MVLVDTSVWIRALSNRAPFAEELARLLDLDEVAGHDLVYGELLIGDRGGRKKLLTAYEQMSQATTVPHPEVVTFVKPEACMAGAPGGSIFTCWPHPLWME